MRPGSKTSARRCSRSAREVGEDRGRGRAHRQAPLAEPGRGQQARAEGPEPADQGKTVVGEVVLGGPGVEDLGDLEALASPRLQRPVALDRVVLPRLVGLAADHQQLLPADRDRAQRVGRALVAEVHALGDVALERGRAGRRSARRGCGRSRGRGRGSAGGWRRSPGRPGPRRRPRSRPCSARARRPRPRGCPRGSRSPPRRRRRRARRGSGGRGTRPGPRSGPRRRSRRGARPPRRPGSPGRPRPLGDPRLLGEPRPALAGLGVGEVRLAAEVALDPVALHRLGDRRQPRLVCLAVGPRSSPCRSSSESRE